VQFVIGPISHTLSFLFNIVSRTFEYQADAFAVKLGYAEPLKVGLIRLQVGSSLCTSTWIYNPASPDKLVITSLKYSDNEAGRGKS
jgi:Zn-dependent protease with chaperone function